MSIICTPPVNMRRMDLCFCSSGMRFRDCCGSFSAERKPPHGVHIVPEVLSVQETRAIIDIASQSRKTSLGIQKENPETGEVEIVVNSLRVAEEIDLAEKSSELNRLVIRVWESIVQPLTGQTVEWVEQPGLVCYPAGGHCFAHADSDVFNDNTYLWERRYDRDYSMLIYLNDDYEGGEIKFNNFNYSYKPRAGDLLLFPSDQRYMHQADKVISGSRYAVVSFAAIVGGLRSYPAPTAPLIMRKQ